MPIVWHIELAGRPVEAIISPVSPYAAVLPGKLLHSRTSKRKP